MRPFSKSPPACRQCSPVQHHGGHQSHSRRVGRLALHLVLALLAQVKVIARILRGLHRLPCPLAHAQISQPGGIISDFCEPPISTSTPQASTSMVCVPRPVMPSLPAACPCPSAARPHLPRRGSPPSRSQTPACTQPCARASTRLHFVDGEGLAVGLFEYVTWQPNALARSTQRSPNLPAVSTSTGHPVRSDSRPMPPSRPCQSKTATTHRSWCHKDLQLCDHLRKQGAELRRPVVNVCGGHGN